MVGRSFRLAGRAVSSKINAPLRPPPSSALHLVTSLSWHPYKAAQVSRWCSFCSLLVVTNRCMEAGAHHENAVQRSGPLVHQASLPRLHAGALQGLNPECAAGAALHDLQPFIHPVRSACHEASSLRRVNIKLHHAMRVHAYSQSQIPSP